MIVRIGREDHLIRRGGRGGKCAVGLSLYEKKKRSLVLPFDLKEFSAVIFPSTASINDFLASLSKEQLSQVSMLKAFAMGKKVQQAAIQAGFGHVVI